MHPSMFLYNLDLSKVQEQFFIYSIALILKGVYTFGNISVNISILYKRDVYVETIKKNSEKCIKICLYIF